MLRSFVALMLVNLSIFASQDNIDSLLLVSKSQTGEEKVNTLINISRHYFINKDTLAIRFSQEAIALAQNKGYVEGVGKAMLFLGLAWSDIKPDSALKYYLRSSDILSTLEHPWAHYGYKNAADIYINRGWFPEALDLTFKILEINEKSRDSILMSESMSTLGQLHINLRNYDLALNWQKRAYEILGNKEINVRRGLILGRIGIIYNELHKYDSSNYFNLLAIDYFEKAGNKEYMAQWMSNLANTYIIIGDYKKAEDYLVKALGFNISDDRKPPIYDNLAKVYLETNRYRQAKTMLDSAEFYAVKFQLLRFLAEVWYRRHELSLKLGNPEEALKHFKNYAQLNDSLLDVTKTEQIAQMLARYEIEKKEKALLFEKSEKERIERERYAAQVSLHHVQKWIWGISFFSLLLIFHILLYLMRIKRKARDEKNLAILQEKERGLSAIIQAQEEERKRVAKDLHDGVGQQISALSLNFQALSSKIRKQTPDILPEAEKIKRMIMAVSHDVREVSHQMMPRALTQFGLVDALEDMIESSLSKTGIKFSFAHEGMNERLSQTIEIGLYRVAQEVINNVIKHSQATKVDFRLTHKDNTVHLIISDDGKGFDSLVTKGIGLTNIESRVSAMNGLMSITSEKNTGTMVSIKVNC